MGMMESTIHSFTKIDDELISELEEILIMGDVGMATSSEICSRLRTRIKQRGVTDPALVKGPAQGDHRRDALGGQRT